MRANGQGFGRRCWPRSTERLVNAPRHGRAPDERCDCRATTAACEYSKHENWQMIRVEFYEIVRPADLELEPVSRCMRDAREVSSIAKVNGECRTLAVPVVIPISSGRPFCPKGWVPGNTLEGNRRAPTKGCRQQGAPPTRRQ